MMVLWLCVTHKLVELLLRISRYIVPSPFSRWLCNHLFRIISIIPPPPYLLLHDTTHRAITAAVATNEIRFHISWLQIEFGQISLEDTYGRKGSKNYASQVSKKHGRLVMISHLGNQFVGIEERMGGWLKVLANVEMLRILEFPFSFLHFLLMFYAFFPPCFISRSQSHHVVWLWLVSTQRRDQIFVLVILVDISTQFGEAGRVRWANCPSKSINLHHITRVRTNSA